MVAHWLAELDGRRVAVEVPGSAANLGAGYDCLGVALAVTNKVEVEVRGWSRGEIELTIDGEGQGELTEDRDNRFVAGIEAAMRAARGALPDGVGWRIEMHNNVPLARGLGSSASATVGGLLAGNALLGDPPTVQFRQPVRDHPASYQPSATATAPTDASASMNGGTCRSAVMGSLSPWPVRTHTMVASGSSSPVAAAFVIPARLAAEAGSQKTPS